MNKYYSALQIDLILEKIKFYIHTYGGAKLLEASSFYVDYVDFNIEQNLLDDAIHCFYRFGGMPIYNSPDFIKDVKYMQKGGSCSTETFSAILNETKMAQNIISYCSKYINNYSHLKELTDGLKPLDTVVNAITRVFDEEFEVRDSASDDLNKFRKARKKIENNVKNIVLRELNRYKDYLSEPSYSIRNNAFVLPVKTTFKGRVNGLIHDVSDSGETTFIEPEECLICSNEIVRLTNLEKEEIRRILDALSREIALSADDIIKNNEIISKLDLLNAKFQYAKEINATTIKTYNDSSFNLIEARHPLIDPKVVVANSLTMSDEDKQLIISGPNAGGKSVFLKLIGLLVLMNQLIIPLPCSESSTLGFFNHIFIDIGDLQSIQENLSTFSGHILNVSNILNSVSNKDLVLIDELGTGTDPKEGEALAIAICKYLRENGCKSLITSHFEGVKEYAITTRGVLSASMIFDEETLTPKYKLLLGIPGKSYGINIARKYGINKDVIKDSKDYLASNKIPGEADYVGELTKKIHEVNDLINANNTEKEALKQKEQEYKQKINDLTLKLRNFNVEMEKEKEAIVSSTEEKLNTLKELLLKNGTIKLNEVIDAQKELENILSNTIEVTTTEIEESKESESTINIGDYVSYDELGIEGKVISISRKGYNIITSGGKTYSLNKENIHKISHIETKNKPVESSNVDTFISTQASSYELNVIGYHVDEAIDALDHYIDSCLLRNRKTFRVIHGFGSGALRTAIHNYLKKSKYVKSYQLGGEFDGGMGATIVNLK